MFPYINSKSFCPSQKMLEKSGNKERKLYLVLLISYAGTQVRRYAGTQVRRYAGTQVRRYADMRE
jgi:hypothetical protein